MASENNISIVINVENTEAVNKLNQLSQTLQQLAQLYSKELKGLNAAALKAISDNNKLKLIEAKKNADKEIAELKAQKAEELKAFEYAEKQKLEALKASNREKVKEVRIFGTKSIGELEKQAGTAKYAFINLNRTISDMPFFFRSIDMGIVAISNNLDPLIQSFAQLKQETGSWKEAFSMLKGQLLGTGGLLLGFALVNAAITAFALLMEGAEKKTKKQTEAIKKQKDELKELRDIVNQIVSLQDPTKILIGDGLTITFEQLGKNIKKAEKDLEEYNRQLQELENETKKEAASSIISSSKVLKTSYDTTAIGRYYSKEVVFKDIEQRKQAILEEKKLTEAWYKEYSDMYNKSVQKQQMLNKALQSGYLEGAYRKPENTGDTKDDKPTRTYADFIANLQDQYMEMTKNRYDYERYMAENEYIKALGEIKSLSEEEKWSIEEIDDAKAIALNVYNEKIRKINEEQKNDELEKLNEYNNKRQEYIDTIYEYEVELSDDLLGKDLKNLESWYNEQKEKHTKLLQEKIINETEFNNAIKRLDNVKAMRDGKIRMQENRRRRQEIEQKYQELREEYEVVDILSKNAAQTLRDEFINVWNEIFGEANSLFEKFISRVVSDLANLGTMYLARGIFGGLLDILGLGGGAAVAAAAIPSSRPISQTVVNVSLDGQIVDRRVINNFGNYQTVARNRRLL